MQIKNRWKMPRQMTPEFPRVAQRTVAKPYETQRCLKSVQMGFSLASRLSSRLLSTSPSTLPGSSRDDLAYSPPIGPAITHPFPAPHSPFQGQMRSSTDCHRCNFRRQQRGTETSSWRNRRGTVRNTRDLFLTLPDAERRLLIQAHTRADGQRSIQGQSCGMSAGDAFPEVLSCARPGLIGA